ncbi:cell wall-active antibiotics response protein LiaF [Kyrpidia tusciae]|uniref:Cell wall-active antibiotics response protein n=1 Tax=Kyrpidia tusciae (strain DSM 2912 / NBRC 15312 / T2) TaxID=562970 RepID=D5WY45_KYRT2|nr:cell wall-active antibiotics response protein LiaF [Kyrpidia tusciae]ADG06104.1 Cell wall-active antibiotics response protein [Kyrpidia tusciae DSM 2912]
MDRRRRNTALLFLACGLYLLLFRHVGLAEQLAILLLVLGILGLRKTSLRRLAGLLIVLGILLLIGWHLVPIASVVLLASWFWLHVPRRERRRIPYLYRRPLHSVRLESRPWLLQDQGFLGAIGEYHIDFNLAVGEKPETFWMIQNLAAKVEIWLPEDAGAVVEASTLFGRVEVPGRRDEGLINRVKWKSPFYEQSRYRFHFRIVLVMGDIEIKQV